jgi:hypothetical protein
VEYLEGGGEHVVAAVLTGAELDDPAHGLLVIRLAPSAAESLHADARALATITAAVRDLLADEQVRVRVR